MFIGLLKHTLMITSFVFIMMLLIEYINVQTRGDWQLKLQNNRWGQYILGAFLGAMPGCLGAFSVVSLYAHRVVTLGALVTTMIATSGDEAFLMFSMFPLKALWITAALFLIGIIAGYITDLLPFSKNFSLQETDHGLEIHDTESCKCFPRKEVFSQLRHPSFPRALLMGILGLFLLFLVSGSVGPQTWDWKRITFLIGALFGFFVVATVPDHFLEEHLWEHVLKKHLLRIFLWTFGALLLVHYIEQYINLEAWINDNFLLVLVIAVLIGTIPEPGPHMVFVTLFAQGALPLSILFASSIVQDGHGMLPLLAVSKRSFLGVKLINIVIGLLVGLIGLVLL